MNMILLSICQQGSSHSQILQLLHCIYQRSIAFEAVGRLFTDLIQEIVERDAEYKYLKDLKDFSLNHGKGS